MSRRGDPRGIPRGPKGGPKGTQGGTQGDPRGPKGDPRGPKGGPKGTQGLSDAIVYRTKFSNFWNVYLLFWKGNCHVTILNMLLFEMSNHELLKFWCFVQTATFSSNIVCLNLEIAKEAASTSGHFENVALVAKLQMFQNVWSTTLLWET